MQYRINPKNGDKLSALGYGCLRLPSHKGVVDTETSINLLRMAADKGVNYFDTGYIYFGGMSERVLGEAFAGARRDEVKLATKLLHPIIKSRQDMDSMLSEQLKRLKTDRIDYYLMHGLVSHGDWERLLQLDILSFLEDAKAAGKLINIGFSFHGGPRDFMQIIDAYSWDFCMIQYNYYDEFNQAGKIGLRYAAEKGVPVMVMEPLRGGQLVNLLPKEIKTIWDSAPHKRSPAEWALRFVWNHPEVLLLLSGMNREADIDENIRVACEAGPNSLTDEELRLFDTVRECFSRIIRVDCTGCGYCMPCPAGVSIPDNLEYLNNLIWKSKIRVRAGYTLSAGLQRELFSGKFINAGQCVRCGKCISLCPQGIPIPEKLAEVAEAFEGSGFRLATNLIGRYVSHKKRG